MEHPKILVIEDEQRLAGILKNWFETEGFTVDIALDGYLGKRMIEKSSYSLIILDINIPLINGYDLCREIRGSNNDVPILMLTALSTMDNMVAGFEAGADDYLPKPFDFRELLVRVNALLKRTGWVKKNEILGIADLVMDLREKTVTRSGNRIDLTVREFALLKLFLMNRDKLLSRTYIIEEVWGIDFDPGSNVIDVYINYLRKKIDRNYSPRLIHTKFGFGFYCSEKEI